MSGELIIAETPLNKTGRANDELGGSKVRDSRYVGPCPYVLTGPTISARGHLLACCGVIPQTDRLILKENISAEEISNEIERALSSELLMWLFLRGPYDLAERISSVYGITLEEKEQLGGNCEACKLLFESRFISDKIDEFLSLYGHEIVDESSILGAIGLMNPKGVQMVKGRESLIDT